MPNFKTRARLATSLENTLQPMVTDKLSTAQAILLARIKEYANLPDDEFKDSELSLNEGQLLSGLDPETLADCSMNRFCIDMMKQLIVTSFPNINISATQSSTQERMVTKVVRAVLARRSELQLAESGDTAEGGNEWDVYLRELKVLEAEADPRNLDEKKVEIPAGLGNSGQSSSPSTWQATVPQMKKSVRESVPVRFSGKLKEEPAYDMWLTLAMTAIQDSGVSRTDNLQKIRLLGLCVDGEVLRALQNSISPSVYGNRGVPDEAVTLQEAISRIESLFCSPMQRMALLDERNSLSLEAIAIANDVSKADALDIVAARINTLSANGPPRDNADDSKAAALDSALRKELWATPVISQRKTESWPLSVYVAKLQALLRTLELQLDDGVELSDQAGNAVHLGKPSLRRSKATPVVPHDVSLASMATNPPLLLQDQFVGRLQDPSSSSNDVFFNEQKMTARRKQPRRGGVPNIRGGFRNRNMGDGRAGGLRQEQGASRLGTFDGHCNRCGKYGHKALFCRSPRSTSRSSHDVMRRRIEDSGGDPWRTLYALCDEQELVYQAQDEATQVEDRAPEIDEEDAAQGVNAFEAFFTCARGADDDGPDFC